MESDIIPPEHAAHLLAVLPTAPPEQKPQIVGILERYRDQQAKRENDAEVKLRSHFTDTKGYGLDPIASQELDLTLAKTINPKAQKLRLFNERLLAREFKQPLTEAARNYEAWKQAYGEREFGDGKLSDEGLHSKIGEVFKLEDQAWDASEKAVLGGKPSLDAWGKFLETAKSSGVWSEKRQYDLYQQWQKGYKELNARVTPYRELIRDVSGEIQGNLGETAKPGFSFRSIADKLLKVPAADRDIVIAAIGETGAVIGDKKQNIWIDILRSAGRSSEAIVGQTESTMRRLSTIEGSGFEGVPTNPDAGEAAKVTEMENLVSRIRSIATGRISPIKREGRFQQALVDTGGSLPFMGVSLIPYAGPAMITAQFREDNLTDLLADNPGMKQEDAEAIATVAAPIQAFGQVVASRFIAGRLPNLAKLTSAPLLTLPGAAMRFGVRTIKGTAVEQLEENVQQVTPLAVQQIASALKADIKGPDWDKYTKDLWEVQKQIFGPALILSTVGAGAVTLSNLSESRHLARDRDLLIASNFAADKADAISAAADKGDWATAQDIMRSSWNAVEVPIAERRAAAERVIARSQSAAGVIQEKIREAGVSIERLPDGWQVSDGKQTVIFPTHEEAMQAVGAHLQELDIQKDENTLEVFRAFSAAAKEGESFTISDRALSLADLESDAAAKGDQGAVDAIWQRLELERQKSGKPELGLADLHVLGQSVTEFKEGVANYANRIYAGGRALDLVEEKAENDLRRFVNEGRTTLANMAAMIRDVELATGDTYLNGDNETAITEAYSDLARLWATGTRGSKIAKPVRSQEAGVVRQQRARLRAAGESGKAAPLIQALKDTLEFFKATLQQAAKLMKAKKAGKLKDIEKFLNESVGLSEQVQHVEGVTKDIQKIAGKSFSLANRPKGDTVPDADKGTTAESRAGQLARSLGGGKASRPARFQGTSKADWSAQTEALQAQARDPEEDGRTELKSGGEHAAYFSADGKQVLKLTLPGFYGYIVDEDVAPNFVPDGEPLRRLKTRRALPSEYLHRVSEMDRVFDVPIEFTGVETSEDGPLIGTVMPNYGNRLPGDDFAGDPRAKDREGMRLIANYMQERGFAQLDEDQVKQPGLHELTWYRESDGVMVSDAAPDNFRVIKINGKDELVPIDLMISHVPLSAADLRKKQAGGQSFSLTTSDRLEAISRALGEQTKDRPEARRSIMQRAKDAFNKARQSWEDIARDANLAASQKNTDAEMIGADLARLRADFDADMATLRDERETEIGGARTDKAGRDAIEAIRKDFEARLTRRRMEYERERTDLEKRRDSVETESQTDNRKSLTAALRTLDAVLSVLPSNVRAKIGGFVKLSELTTDAARIAEIERRFEKIGPLLEKYFRKELTAQVEKLFDKYRPERGAGEKPKGKLGADVQELVDAAEAAMDLSAIEVAGRLADIDAQIAVGDLTAEQEIQLERKRALIELFGDWKNADAARMNAALDALDDTASEGWAKWRLKQIIKREEREEKRANIQAGAGISGRRGNRQKAEVASGTIIGKLSNSLRSLSSFAEIMGDFFGNSSAAVDLVDRERDSSNAHEDDMQQYGDMLADFFKKLGDGNVTKGEQIHYDLAQPKIETTEGSFSELQAATAILMWRQADGRKHMQGHLDESAQPVGDWHYNQEFVDKLEAGLSDNGRAFLGWLSSDYAAEYEKLNPIYRERHGINLPRNESYAPLSVTPKQSDGKELANPLTGAVATGGIVNPGFLRSRSSVAIAEPEFRDAIQVWMAHKRMMSYWEHYYDLATDLNAIMGSRNVRNVIKAKAGEDGAKLMQKWQDYFAQGGIRDAAAGLTITDWQKQFVARNAQIAILGRATVLFVQGTQLAAASVKMPTGAYLMRFSKLIAGKLGWGDAINSAFIQRRIQQGPPVVQQMMKGLGEAKNPNQIRHAIRTLGKDLPGKAVSGADGLFTAGTYAILLDYHRAEGAKMGMQGQELESYAHNIAERDTEAVAQPTRGATRSMAELTATHPLSRMMWAFASESRQKLLLFAWGFKNAGKSPAYFAKVSFLAFVVGGLFPQIIKNLWRDAKGDDDEEKWSPSRLAMKSVTAPFAGIPGASTLLDSGPTFSAIKRAPDSINDLLNEDQSAAEIIQDIDTLLSAGGLFSDSAASMAVMSHVATDAAKIVEKANE